MTNEEAKFILRAYRPNGADAADPAFLAALEQARLDPVLGQWFQHQQNYDRAIAAKLLAVQPPANLREMILAGARAEQPAKPAWWFQPKWLAMAAMLVLTLAIGVGSLTGPRAQAADAFPVFATDYVASGFFLKEHGNDLEKLRQWLASRSAPLPKEIPAGFSALRSLGCKTLDYRGKEVSLICFGEGKEYHLFVARRSDFPEISGEAAPQFLVRSGHATVTWSDENNHYVVVTDDSLKALMECVGCQQS